MATFPAKTNYAAGNVLTAAQMVDIGEQINALNGNAGKNKIINGDFNINQRGFTSTTTTTTYGFDRFQYRFTGGTNTYSAQTFTPGSAPVAGYESTNFARIATTGQSATGDFCYLLQRIEDVRTLAGQTATISFWAKASSGTPNVGVSLEQSFGAGGSSLVVVNAGVSAITTSWARYSFTVSVPSVSGKTIGANSLIAAGIFTSAGTGLSGSGYPAVGIQNTTIDIWGVQVEAGSVATAFQTATGTLAGELQAAQRYYYLHTSGDQKFIGNDTYYATTSLWLPVQFPVTMRGTPTLSATSGTNYYRSDTAGTTDYVNSFTIYLASTTGAFIYNNSEAAGTAGNSGLVFSNNAAASIAFSAEL